MKKLKSALIYILYFLTFCVLVIWGLGYYIYISTSGKIYENPKALPAAHTAIILGASVHSDGKLSPILKERVDAGLMLYREKKVTRFLLSGDNRTPDYDEVSAMRAYLVRRGVPETHIFVDPAGLNTYDSMYRSREIYEVPSAIIVTQQFHLPRALFIATNLGLNYKGYPADSKHYKTDLNLLRREKLANFKAVYELVSRQIPRTMGKKVPVTGTHN